MPDAPTHQGMTKRPTATCSAVVIGGGLAGLALSILLSRSGYPTLLFEKEKYPFHKVCGEYVSLESWNFIERLGLDLKALQLPVIKKLVVSSPNGKSIHAALDLGGFGISRYLLDSSLKGIAEQNGVIVREDEKVTDVQFADGSFHVQSRKGTVETQVVAGTFGKRSNLDVKARRGFVISKPGKLDNYIGVKYHVRSEWPKDTIALHNFSNGYCGISAIENDTCCLCYLTNAQVLKENGNSIKRMEENVLSKNPYLRKIFTESEFLFGEPVAISQVSFAKKEQVKDHILMSGDAAGMITPLCGNGMSIALHSAKIAFENINPFLQGITGRSEMEYAYNTQWQKQFGNRLRNGRIIQRFFGKATVTNWFVSALQPFPLLINRLIKSTHGTEF